MVETALLGPIGLFVKFSTLQDYGVDKVFSLETKSADVSQRNVVFIARGECAKHAQSIAGTLNRFSQFPFSQYLKYPVSSQERLSEQVGLECLINKQFIRRGQLCLIQLILCNC